MRYDHFTMLPIQAFRPIGGRMTLEGGGKNDSPDPPDYTPVAQASEESARIGAEQADRVLAESKRQYDRNMEVAQPVIDAQLGLMKSSQQQGDEYYDYWKTKAQPVEDALNADAMASGTPQAQEEAAARASADARAGTTQQANMIARQGLRYGYSPTKMGKMAADMAGSNASMIASATYGAREREKALGTAKRLDVAGLYRGMPGASQGAYGAATQAGNSAVGNSVNVGNGMVSGTNAAAGLTMQGQGMRLQGLNGILGTQTSIYNNNQDSGGGLGGALGLAKMGMDIYSGGVASKLWGSDRRIKENIKRVGETVHGLGLYEFNYIDDDTRYRGVMADEVEAVKPEAVAYDDLGFASVNYGLLGIEMEEV